MIKFQDYNCVANDNSYTVNQDFTNGLLSVNHNTFTNNNSLFEIHINKYCENIHNQNYVLTLRVELNSGRITNMSRKNAGYIAYGAQDKSRSEIISHNIFFIGNRDLFVKYNTFTKHILSQK